MIDNELIVWAIGATLIALLVWFVAAIIYDCWRQGIFDRNRKF